MDRLPGNHQEVPTTVEQLLAAARAQLTRLSPDQAHAAMCDGAQLIDIRSDSQRAADGIIPGAHFVARNVLEWRLDPACPHRDPLLARPDVSLVLICDAGYQSSLAAATVQRFGRSAVTDVIGGFRGWRAAGLPVQPRSHERDAVRAVDCPCGRHLEGAVDEELSRKVREHVDRDHPEMEHGDEDIRARIAADAYDTEPASER